MTKALRTDVTKYDKEQIKQLRRNHKQKLLY